jgi:hypothetical protein
MEKFPPMCRFTDELDPFKVPRPTAEPPFFAHAEPQLPGWPFDRAAADPQLEGRAVPEPKSRRPTTRKNGTMSKEFAAGKPIRPSHDELDASPSDEQMHLVTVTTWPPSVPPPLPPPLPSSVPPAWLPAWLQKQQPSQAPPPPRQDEAAKQQDEAPEPQDELPIPPPPPLPIPPPPPPRQRGGSNTEFVGLKFHRDAPPWKHETHAASGQSSEYHEDHGEHSMWSGNNDRSSSSKDS